MPHYKAHNIDGGEWPTSVFTHFAYQVKQISYQIRGWMVCKPVVDVVVKNWLLPTGDRTQLSKL
jgi:hypothetical protein